MKRSVVSLASFITLTVGGAAAAQAGTPAWCKAEGTNKLNVYGELGKIHQETDPADALYTLVAAFCAPDADATAQARELAATRKLWSKRLHMTDADWADAAAWAVTHHSDRNPSIYPPEKTAWSKYGPIDQWAGITRSAQGDSSQASDPAYAADAFGAELTEAGRLGYVSVCIGSELPAEWAMCADDIARFDAAKLSTELRGDTGRTAKERITVRLEAYRIAAKIPAHQAKVKELLAKDPAYARLFTLADAARKEWEGRWKSDARLLALMASMDDARVTRSRKAAEGCEEATWLAWKNVLSTVPARKFAAIRHEPGNSFTEQAMAAVVAQPEGFLAGMSLYVCARSNKGEDFMIRALGEVMERWPGFRGPRTATQTAIVTAGIELDDRDARIEQPGVLRSWVARNSGSSGGGEGAVKSIKAQGTTVRIEFVNIKKKQTVCIKGHHTRRVTQIRSDGGLVYEYVCTKEKTETITVPQANPQTVNARYAVGIKPGMFVSVTEDVVTAAYAKGREVPSMVVGVPVK
jgi:hypothetical protein